MADQESENRPQMDPHSVRRMLAREWFAIEYKTGLYDQEWTVDDAAAYGAECERRGMERAAQRADELAEFYPQSGAMVAAGVNQLLKGAPK